MRRAGLSILLMMTIGLSSAARAFAEHEFGLRHRAFLGVDDQQAAVGHVQRALDFAREVSVARRVDDIDPVVAVLHGRNLGGDGDAAFAFLVAAVHDQILAHLGLVVTEGLRLLQQPVDQRRFAMVNMGDNRDITNLSRVLNVLHEVKILSG